MPPSLTNLQDLRTALGRLNAERPAKSRAKPGETAYEERGGGFRRRLHLETESRRGKARILVTGQIGVGKSSELLQFLSEVRGEEQKPFVVYCDLEREEHPERCGATGVFLTVFRDCWSATQWFRRPSRELLRVRDETTERLIDWLKGEYTGDRRYVAFRIGGMEFKVSLNEPDRALAIILGKAAQHEAVSEPTERFGLVPDSLIILLNKLLRRLASGQQPLLIVDHVDKIRNDAAAEEVLVKAVPHWGRIEASIIMTAPFEHTLGALRNSVESRWGRPLHLHPLPFPALDSPSIPPIYLQIVRSAGLERLIRPESLKVLAHYSGGVLRGFVQFLINACMEASLAGHDTIEIGDAEAVVYAAERAYQDYSVEDFVLLDQIDRTGTGLGQAATLLRSPIGLLVAEPSGREQRLTVHPLAQSALERYRMRRTRTGT